MYRRYLFIIISLNKHASRDTVPLIKNIFLCCLNVVDIPESMHHSQQHHGGKWWTGCRSSCSWRLPLPHSTNKVCSSIMHQEHHRGEISWWKSRQDGDLAASGGSFCYTVSVRWVLPEVTQKTDEQTTNLAVPGGYLFVLQRLVHPPANSR